MDHFERRGKELFCEEVPLSEIARTYGTPCYVYSSATIERHYRAFDQAFGDYPHQICYAVKANSNIAILQLLARLGSGFDIVSSGELRRVLAAGGDPAKTIFSGVGKTPSEIRFALATGIQCFNVESISELQRINSIAGDMGRRAPISIRVNPDVDAATHPYISTGLKENKFGIDINEAVAWYREAAAMPNIEIVGVDCHIGSQLTRISPYVDALQRVLTLVSELKGYGISLRHVDVGGGLGIRYKDETPPLPGEYAQRVVEQMPSEPYTLIIEPGRAIVGNAGVLLTEVQYLKNNGAHHFAIVDAAMNDLLRPSLYQAWQDIVPILEHDDAERREYDVVGPICETGDYLGKQRSLSLNEGDLLAVRSAGAYGFAMSSNYNSRGRAAEILVTGNRCHVIRARETDESLYASESLVEYSE